MRLSLRHRARAPRRALLAWATALAASVACLLCCGSARADDDTRASRPPDRPVPDYDGLEEPGDDAGDVALWTARALTSPLYLLSEYVLRRPIGWAMTEIERNDLVSTLLDFFTFGPNDEIIVLPTVFYEMGFQPSVGLYAAWSDFLFRHNRIAVHAGYGGDEWLSFSAVDRIALADRWQLGARFLARERPDYVFGGIGPNATDLPRARFGAERIEPELFTSARYWQSSDVEIDVRYRSISFYERSWSGEPSIGERALQTGEPLPVGYASGYEAVGTELHADLDTRTPFAPPEGGARVAAHVGIHTALGGAPQIDRWLSWGASGTLAADLIGGHRVLGLTGDVDLVTPLSGSSVPFTELVELGGSRGLLPGYRPGHILGQSALGLTAHYTWPIWAFLDARLYFGAANAFGLHLEDFDAELLRLTFGLAIAPRLQGTTDLPFTFNFGFATDTFERGASVDSFRIEVGAREVL